MKTQDCDILQIVNPTIKLRELSIPDLESRNEDGTTQQLTPRTSKVVAYVPIIVINGYRPQLTWLTSFELNLTSFMPTIMVQFIDGNNEFQSRYFPTDGSIMQVYIGSPGDETIYKPIRIDFTITSVRCVCNTGNPELGSGNVYALNGTMRIPKAMGRKSHSEENSSFNSLLNISKISELGFASNVDSTNDTQKWINTNKTFDEYVNDITTHAYIDDDNFFTSFIDPYYNLNFVEVDRLFTQDGNKDSKKSYVFPLVPQMSSNEEFDAQQKETSYSLTNHTDEKGWCNYISSYNEISNANSTFQNGYRKYVQYFDYNNREFVSEYVDPLTHNTEGMIPITKGKLYEGEPEDNLRDELASYTYFGIQDTDSQHDNFYWASVQNQFNNEESSKFGLEVILDGYYPAITRYSRIWVDIYEKNTMQIAINTTKASGKITDINYDSAPQINAESNKIDDYFKNLLSRNESLSGWYVIKGVKIFLDISLGIIRHKLYLYRREMKPAKKEEIMKD